ncbi:MAG TPA: hypothetical protein VF175_18230 [Lacipirellula sp.]
MLSISREPRVFMLSIAALVLIISMANASGGSEIAVSFTAAQPFYSKPTFGFPAPAGPVSGQFIYESETPPNYTVPDKGVPAKGYRHQRAGGFAITFGDLQVIADDYVVELYDNLPQPDIRIADVVTVVYSSDLAPPPTTPLLVNGTPYASGQMIVSFLYYGGQLFDEPDLAALSGIDGFGKAMSFLGDVGDLSEPSDVFVFVDSAQTQVFAPADFDRDSDVDGADLLIWQRALGDDGSAGGDADRNGIVDAADRGAWREAFGATTATAAVPTPEPRAASLAVMNLLFYIAGSRRRTGQRRPQP